MTLRNAFEDLAEDVTLQELIQLLGRINRLLESLGVVDSSQRQRVVLDAITSSLTLAAVSTVSTVSNAAAIGGYNHQLFTDPARTAWNTGLRARITVN